jgi:hypothetical protein
MVSVCMWRCVCLHSACVSLAISEGEEGGRRQAEEHLRAKQEVVYKQMMRTHQQAAESFVDDLFESTMNSGKCCLHSGVYE